MADDVIVLHVMPRGKWWLGLEFDVSGTHGIAMSRVGSSLGYYSGRVGSVQIGLDLSQLNTWGEFGLRLCQVKLVKVHHC